MTSVLERLRKKLRDRQGTQDRAEERLVCPECASEFARFEILNNTSRCLQCGTLIDVDKKPKVFS